MIFLLGNPLGIDVNGLSRKIYVANSGDNTISVIDESNDTKIGNDIPVGKDPLGIFVDSLSGKIYVTNSGDNTISVIDGGKIILRFLLGKIFRNR